MEDFADLMEDSWFLIPTLPSNERPREEKAGKAAGSESPKPPGVAYFEHDCLKRLF